MGTRQSGLRTARLTEAQPHLTVLDISLPDVLGPIVRRRGWWFDVFSQPWVLETVAWATDRVAGPDPAVLAWTPTVAAAVEQLAPARMVFDSLDNWLIHPALRRHADQARAGYARILPRASAVVASAPASKVVLEEWASHVTVIPNGVDPRQFDLEQPRPADLPPPPIVGYAGSLAQRIDARLVAAVAAAMPGVHFVFIGRVMDRRAIQPMTGLPNVHILGNRHYDLLPGYLSNFDIAWIPHSVGPGETGGDPIKLYEYWAAGRQVVAMPIDGISRWASQVHFVTDAAQATEAIAGLLAGRIPPKPTTVPDERTWAAIADVFVGLLSPDTQRGGGLVSIRAGTE